MRIVLYSDLAGMFWATHNIVNATDVPEQERGLWQKEQLRNDLLFRGEKYCADKPHLYLQLPERHAAERIYPYFHSIIENQVWTGVNSHLALNMFSNAVHDRNLKAKYFRRVLGRKDAASLLRLADYYYRENQELLERMGATNEPGNPPDRAT